MSKRVTINLPDEVAERLEREPNVSQYVTNALRDRIKHEERAAATQRMLSDAGYVFTDDGLATMRAKWNVHNARRAARQAAAGAERKAA